MAGVTNTSGPPPAACTPNLNAANYLTSKAPYLDYPTATTANGWPIATGIIEGACRHLVKDQSIGSSSSASLLLVAAGVCRMM